jgi:hypothetical protein
MVRERLIDKRMLPFERLGRAAARLRFVIKFAVDNIREEFSDGSQSRRFVPVNVVERLPEDKLTAVGMVSDVEPIPNAAVRAGNPLVNYCSGGSRIYAADDQIEVVGNLIAFGHVFWHCIPIQAPEQVQPVDQNHRLEQPDLARGERLANAVGRRNSVSIKYGDRQS